PPDTLQRMARRERPRATARSWSALVAGIPGGTLTKVATPSSALSWSAMSLGAKATLVGLAAATVLAVGVAVSQDADEPTSPREPTTASVRAVPDSSAQVPGRPAADPAEPEGPERSSETAEIEPTIEPPPAPRPSSPTPAGEPVVAPAAPRSLAAENALLREAAVALAAGNPARALELADRHAKEHASSPMVDISTALRIESLCALGKQAQARGETAVFLRRRPRSPMADRIGDACPEESTTAP
ncbi:MAG: hypothetical protein AB1Z98_19195, partial [Nannocystaceae bacterium]